MSKIINNCVNHIIESFFKSTIVNFNLCLFQELKLSNTALEAKIIEHEKSLQSKSKEINNLTEDNARLSMEMTSATKENGVANGVHNGDGKEHDLT